MTISIGFGHALVVLSLVLLLADTAFNSRAALKGWRDVLSFGRARGYESLPDFSSVRRRSRLHRTGGAGNSFRHSLRRRRLEAGAGEPIRAAVPRCFPKVADGQS